MTVPYKPWIAVDLDGTLAHQDKYRGPLYIGPPISIMVQRVKLWRAEGKDVRIFTARVHAKTLMDNISEGEEGDYNKIKAVIDAWSLQHLGEALPITCSKDWQMAELWDDRAVRVETNTGRVAGQVLEAEVGTETRRWTEEEMESYPNTKNFKGTPNA